MKRSALFVLLLLVGCMGVPKQQVETALELQKAQATNYTELAVFTRQVLKAGEQAAPAQTKEFWTESLKELDKNVEQFALSNQALMKLIASMETLDDATQRAMFDDLTKLIVAAKTGELPEKEE